MGGCLGMASGDEVEKTRTIEGLTNLCLNANIILRWKFTRQDKQPRF